MRLLTALFALNLLPFTAGTLAAADNPTVNRLLDHWNKSKAYMLEIAGQMPPADYASRPNPEEMTFGQQMVHIANGTLFLVHDLAPKKQDLFDDKKADQESALDALRTSFDAGAAALATLTDADLNTRFVDSGEGKMTALEAVLMAFDHVEHHRGQAIVYLRVKGIRPVDYRF